MRADWVQNYTYKANPDIPFSQSEQLSIRMNRLPGRGWFISDFQGDNGTVQGQLPGPVVTDIPQPDMQVTSVFASYTGGSTAAAQIVPPGPQSFTAVVANTGGADLSAATVVRFTLLDSNNTALTTPTDVSLTLPLAAGGTQNVSASLTVPSTLALGTPLQVQATVNPSCTVAEANCDGAKTSLQHTLAGHAGTPDTNRHTRPGCGRCGGSADGDRGWPGNLRAGAADGHYRVRAAARAFPRRPTPARSRRP